MATREASGKVLNALAPSAARPRSAARPTWRPSNNTDLEGATAISSRDRYGGRNIHFGVREHAMGAIVNGMALHGGVMPYGGTFLVFSDYMRPADPPGRAHGAAASIYVFTHDSIGVGEDGPTHQPVEHAGRRCGPSRT